MAGNKFDTQFSKAKVETVKIEYKALYNTKTTFEGSVIGAINHLMKLL